MRKLCLCFVVISVIIIACFALPAQGVVTSDPNAPGIQRNTSSTDEVDVRLSKKITYDSGYKRLHVVAAEIGKLGGISLSCGKNNSDWRVRDIPVVVCVKGMPLGRLIRAIADATHTKVASERVGNAKGVRGYRIYRRAKEENEIDNLLEQRRQARLAIVDWEWDALATYGKMTPIAKVSNWTNILAKVVSRLDPDAKDRMLNGDRFDFTGRDAKFKDVIADLYRQGWEQMQPGMAAGTKQTVSMNPKDAELALLSLKLADTGNSGKTEIQVNLSPLMYGDSRFGWSGSLDWAQELDGELPNMRPRPKDKTAPDTKADMDDPDMIALRNGVAADWEQEPLNTKIDVNQPKDIKEPVFADLIHCLASASGCNIVIEDFVSHATSSTQQVSDAFKKDTSVADALRKRYFNGSLGYKWFYGKEDKLLIGWADNPNGDSWRDHHRNMLPEAYLTGLKSMLEGDGIQFDDAVHIASLPDPSFTEWIFNSKDFYKTLDQAHVGGSAVWSLYDSLDTADKQAAKSADGLQLAKFDPNWIAGFFRTQKMTESVYCIGMPVDEAEQKKSEEERGLKERAYSDPKAIGTMVMRIIAQPAQFRTVWIKTEDGHDAITSGSVPPELKLMSYHMSLSYQADDINKSINFQFGQLALPIRYAKREAELIKATQATAGNGKSADSN